MRPSPLFRAGRRESPRGIQFSANCHRQHAFFGTPSPLLVWPCTFFPVRPFRFFPALQSLERKKAAFLIGTSSKAQQLLLDRCLLAHSSSRGPNRCPFFHTRAFSLHTVEFPLYRSRPADSSLPGFLFRGSVPSAPSFFPAVVLVTSAPPWCPRAESVKESFPKGFFPPFFRRDRLSYAGKSPSRPPIPPSLLFRFPPTHDPPSPGRFAPRPHPPSHIFPLSIVIKVYLGGSLFPRLAF